MDENEIEKGAASVFIELANGDITVTHGTDKAILLYIPNAKAGSWDKLWDFLRTLKAENSK